MAEAQRQIGALQRLREQNDALLWKWMVHPFAVQLKAEFKPEAYRGIDRSATPQKLSGAMLRDRDGDLYFGGIKITADPTLMPHEIRMVQAPPIDPLDVEYDGVKLRDLLDIDARRRDERNPFRKLSLAQRAAVSAHWSAELRAKVAAGAAADKARETSVVVDLEEP
jgi:hypothetical protein